MFAYVSYIGNVRLRTLSFTKITYIKYKEAKFSLYATSGETNRQPPEKLALRKPLFNHPRVGLP